MEQTLGPHEMILLVEDEPAIRTLMVLTLLRAGYRVREARNGLEALATPHPDLVDLLLVDMHLPYFSGQEVIHRLRRRVPGLKALSISGDPLCAPADPAEPFLAKPFSRDEFLARVRAVLDGAGPSRPSRRGSTSATARTSAVAAGDLLPRRDMAVSH